MRLRTLLLFSLAIHGGVLLLAFEVRPARKPIVITSLSDVFLPGTLDKAPVRSKMRQALAPEAPLPDAAPLESKSSPSASSAKAARVLDIKEILSLGNEAPEYPPLALERGYEGIVRLRLSRNAEGKVGEVHVSDSSGFSLLDRAAVEAAREWKLGKDGPQEIVVPVSFRIETTE